MAQTARADEPPEFDPDDQANWSDTDPRWLPIIMQQLRDIEAMLGGLRRREAK